MLVVFTLCVAQLHTDEGHRQQARHLLNDLLDFLSN